MKKFFIIVSLVIFYITASYSENNTRTDILTEFKNKNSKIFINYDQLEVNAYKLWDLYQKGIQAEIDNDTTLALKVYKEYLSLGPRPYDLNEVELDLLTRLIGISYAKEEWENILLYGNKIFKFPKEILERNSNIAWIFLLYVHSLNMLNRCDNIDKILEEGSFYVKSKYLPTDKDFYDFFLQCIVAYLNKHQKDQAIKLYNELSFINLNEGNNVVDKNLKEIYGYIERSQDPYEDRDAFVKESIRNLTSLVALANTSLPYGENYNKYMKLWEKHFDMLNIFLNSTYFNLSNTSDENIWTQLLFIYHLSINGYMKGLQLPNRNILAYNYILISKNFLNYHSNKIRPIINKWEEIKQSLYDDEIAIEINTYSSEALLLRKNFEKPQIIDIDTLLIKELKKINNYDPVGINHIYKEKGILTQLIKTFDPYITGCKKIFISPSNMLSMINYGAIPYKESQWDDYYEVVQITTTGDIPEYKNRNKEHNFDSVVLFGGISYEERNNDESVDLTHDCHPETSIFTDIPLQLRTGFEYLPHSLDEVKNIAFMCENKNLSYCLYTAEDATSSDFIDCSLGDFGILHIATHSYYLPSLEYNSYRNITERGDTSRMTTIMSNTGLLFAGVNKYLKSNNAKDLKGLITAKEISELDLSDFKLVTLSSCSSALGDLTNINGLVYGLANAFKTSGVDQILVSLWDIPDESTSIFMNFFYENLLNGNDSKKSLKLAQQKMISLGYEDPYYWAAFVILD